MAYKSKAQLISDITNIKTLNVADGKIDAAELQQVLFDILDSVAISSIHTMTDNTFNCNNSDTQIRVLTGNATLAITNALSGKVYLLKKTGNFTLTLPTSELSASGSVVPVGTQWVSFIFDGTDYSFNFSTYSAT